MVFLNWTVFAVFTLCFVISFAAQTIGRAKDFSWAGKEPRRKPEDAESSKNIFRFIMFTYAILILLPAIQVKLRILPADQGMSMVFDLALFNMLSSALFTIAMSLLSSMIAWFFSLFMKKRGS